MTILRKFTSAAGVLYAPGDEVALIAAASIDQLHDYEALGLISNPSTAVASTEPVYVDQALGNDLNDGFATAPVATITRALALATADRSVILVAPGDYAEAARALWPTIKGIQVVGTHGPRVTSWSATGAALCTVAPGVQTSTFEGSVEGITLDHSAGTAQKGFVFDNTDMTKKLLFSFKNCPFSADAATDMSIDVATHDDADNAVRIYMEGDFTQQEIGGAIHFVVNNNEDRLNCTGLWLIGTITTTAVAKSMNIRLLDCKVPLNAATADGDAAQTITAVRCYSWVDFDGATPEAYLALDTTELAGSHSEVIVA